MACLTVKGKQGDLVGILCKIGFHVWKDWSYSRAEGCEQIRMCLRLQCDQAETRVHHQLKTTNISSQDVCQERFCLRCNYTDSTSHDLYHVDYVGGTQHIHVRGQRCSNCTWEQCEYEELG